MPTAELKNLLDEIPGVACRPEEAMAKHLPLRVGGPVELWVEVDDQSALQSTLSAARKSSVRWRIHWPFSDWLVRDGGLRGTVIRLGQDFEQISITEDVITLGAAALWGALPPVLHGGIWDAIRRWSGTVGGLFEIGRQAELSGLCTAMRVLRGGRVQCIEVEPGAAPPSLSENTVLLDLTLRRAAAAPSWTRPPPTTGALFAEVADSEVGRELLKAGVCGTRLRRWRLSTVEPGTVVQLGGGSLADLQLLVKGIRIRVEKTRGVHLETRIPVLGNGAGRRDR